MRNLIPLTAAAALSLLTVTGRAEPDPEPPDSSGWSGVPVVAYLPETGFVVGGYAVHYFRLGAQAREVSPSTVPLLAAVTTEGELGLELMPQIFVGDAGELRLQGDLTTRLRPSSAYFGQGNDTRLADEDEHRVTLFGLDLEVLRRVGETELYAGAAQTFEWRRVDELDDQGLLSQMRPTGVRGGVVSGVGPAAIYDSRPTVHSPLSGSLIRLAALYHPEFLGSDYAFGRFDVDAIHFFSLGGEHVLALRARWQSALGTAPYYRLAELGGSTLLRGYLRGRFVDRHALGAEVEYRFPLYWRFGGVVFAGAGQVAPTPGDLAFDRFHVAAGVGLRFALVPAERLKMRLDVAVSEDAVRPYFAPKEAF